MIFPSKYKLNNQPAQEDNKPEVKKEKAVNPLQQVISPKQETQQVVSPKQETQENEIKGI